LFHQALVGIRALQILDQDVPITWNALDGLRIRIDPFPPFVMGAWPDRKRKTERPVACG
jgi:hypothetical protein